MEPTNEKALFQKVFYEHYPAVRRKLTALLRDETAAEDLAQEVFLRLYRNPPDQPEAVGAWLHRVLTRLAYDYIEKQIHERKLQQKQEQQLVIREGSEPSGEQVMINQLEIDEMRDWLGALSERDRQVLMLRYSGYSYEEIAEQLQVGKPIVGNLIARATTRLKRQANAIGGNVIE